MILRGCLKKKICRFIWAKCHIKLNLLVALKDIHIHIYVSFCAIFRDLRDGVQGQVSAYGLLSCPKGDSFGAWGGISLHSYQRSLSAQRTQTCQRHHASRCSLHGQVTHIRYVYLSSLSLVIMLNNVVYTNRLLTLGEDQLINGSWFLVIKFSYIRLLMILKFWN